MSGGLTGECAMLWYFFLAEEADFENNVELCREYLQQAEALGRVPPASVSSPQLEELIKQYGGSDRYATRKAG